MPTRPSGSGGLVTQDPLVSLQCRKVVKHCRDFDTPPMIF